MGRLDLTRPNRRQAQCGALLLEQFGHRDDAVAIATGDLASQDLEDLVNRASLFGYFALGVGKHQLDGLQLAVLDIGEMRQEIISQNTVDRATTLHRYIRGVNRQRLGNGKMRRALLGTVREDVRQRLDEGPGLFAAAATQLESK